MTSALVLTRNATLRDEVVRLASAAGVDVLAPTDPAGAGAEWRRAHMVVVGADVAADVADRRWVRRGGVLVASWGPPADAVFRPSLDLGAEAVLDLPSSAPRLAERLADAGEGRVSRALVVGVIGGSGGAGATTFALALAQSAARERRVLLVDTDTLGPGLDALLGTAEVSGVRWSEMHGSTGRLGGRTVREALPHVGSLPFLTWSGIGRMPSPELLREVIASARKANELVVLDLSRALDPLVAEALATCDLVLVVVRPTADGVSSARRLITQLPDRARVRAVLRGRQSPVVEDLGVPVVVRMRDHRGIDEAVALGLGPLRHRRGPLGRGVETVLEWLQGGAA
ncbi:hypothetical protein Back2_19850 [Nocardioides baekrokdamisoli]|uniref:Uncharacterized protein n=1 Tax=Nocardioides baekrokdamisoli TaxID=1804624 RepID=A0A3G9J299_9ACTN|nr:septum site-determining protein Ssd [Nocardioides baekrokdamisoli]BBH17698.1 hypothetical protein Back2_19850 [Nocardioides baekrokdamisoli]